MVFTKRLREGVRRGRIRCSFRIWTHPHVKIGGRYPMDDATQLERQRLACVHVPAIELPSGPIVPVKVLRIAGKASVMAVCCTGDGTRR